MTDADLAGIEARAAAATPGPWAVVPTSSYRHSVSATVRDPLYVGDVTWAVNVLGPSIGTPRSGANAAFIAAARADVPALVAEVKRLAAAAEDAGRRVETCRRYFDHCRRVSLSARGATCDSAEMGVRMSFMEDAERALGMRPPLDGGES